jgi:hypothetical protein
VSVAVSTPPRRELEDGAPRTSRARRPLLTSLLALLVAAALAGLGLSGWVPTFAAGSGTVLRGRQAWLVVCAAAALTLALVVGGLVGGADRRYLEDTSRDERLDLIRGLAIVFVVVNDVHLPSLFQLVSQETLGPVSAAELFVALSGAVLGMVYRRRLQKIDLVSATGALWRRAGKLYRTSLLLVLTIFTVTLLPGVDGRVITTFVDQSTGRVYGLYPNIERLLDYPVPGYVLRDLLLLRLGPYQFNIMGLYVVLLLVSPLLVAALRRRLVLVVLLVSWALYAVNTVAGLSVFHASFEHPFPLLTWQLLFVHGMAAGWYRTQLLTWARTGWGRGLVVLAVLGALAMAVYSWSNPFLSNGYDVRLALLPDERFLRSYAVWFLRPTLGLGRVLAVALLIISVYALLTAYWRPVRRLLGWFLVPLGQATLYVFVLHVFFVLLVANVPGLDNGNVLLGTAVHAVVLPLLWLMVRHRVLFSVVPR